MYKATVKVTLKKSVLDPQGQTVQHALTSLGFKETESVRVGKYFEVNLGSANREQAEAQIKSMCDKLLINPVIEEYSYEVREASAS